MSNASSELSPERAFFALLAAGRPSIQRCDDCGRVVFVPRTHCPHCRSAKLSWSAMTPTGTIYSCSDMAAMGERPAANVVLVDMDDGFRMMSTCPAAAPGTLTIGTRVRVEVDASTQPPRLICVVEER